MDTDRERRALFQLARALLAARSARVRFLDTERSTVERTLDVAALAFDPPRWLLAAWAPERASLRLLDLARVLRVRRTRRRARPPPAGFDALDFALRRVLDPDAGPARPAAVLVPARWGDVASALVPGVRVEPVPGGALLHLRTSRPDVLGALAASLAEPAGLDSGSSPCPAHAVRRRSGAAPTRRGSSGSPPGSSASASPRAAPGSTRRSRTRTAGRPRPGSGSSPATRRR